MPHIPNLRSTAPKDHNIEDPLEQPATPQAFVDTPNIIYSEWLKKVGYANPLGTLNEPTEDITAIIIGCGMAGAVCAYELAKAGVPYITMYEATDRIGGRLYSEGTNLGNVAEMGAMRFPPSEACLYYYADNLDYKFTNNFPDPGKVDTLISYKGEAMEWVAKTDVPDAFQRVYIGWNALVGKGLTDTSGNIIIKAFPSMLALLQDPQGTTGGEVNSDLTAAAWQKVLDYFGQHSFYSGLYEIFSGKNGNWNIPGGTAWTDEDFAKFGALGIGSGGFGAVYNSGFCDVYRLVYNSLETNQSLFCDASLKPIGISAVCSELIEAAKTVTEAKGGSFYTVLNAKATIIGTRPFEDMPSPSVRVEFNHGQNSEVSDTVVPATFVINTTSTRAMTIDQNLHYSDSNSYYPQYSNIPNLLDADTRQAIQNIHVVSSGKLFVQTSKFWDNKTGFFPRSIVSDTKAPQLYTLDYDGNSDSGMTLITYTWEDLSVQLDYLAQDLYPWAQVMREQIANLVKDQTSYADYAKNLTPYNGEYIGFNWQSMVHQYGAFALPKPGQDVFVQQAFEDCFHAYPKERGIFLAGDGISWTPGWVEGAIHTALNAVAAIFDEYGSVNEPAYAPTTLLPKYTFNYGVET